MQCTRARRLSIDNELGGLDRSRREALDRHLASCSACAREMRIESRIAGDLALLRVELPFEIDVRQRVMLQLDPVDRREVSLWQLGWSTAAAVAGAAMLAGALWVILPDLFQAARQTLTVVGSFKNAAIVLTAPVIGLLQIPFRLLWSLAGALRAGTPLLAGMQPVVTGVAVVAFLVMTTTIGYVVGRDILPTLRPAVGGGVGGSGRKH